MQSLLHGFIAAIIGTFAALGGLFGPPRTVTVAPQSESVATVYAVVTPSMIAQNAPSSSAPTTPNASSTATTTPRVSSSNPVYAATLPTTTPDLLPQVKLTVKPGTVAQASNVKPAAGPPPAVVRPTPTPEPTTTLAPLTASQFLDQTAISFRETRSGPYEVFFTTNTGSAPIVWNLTNTKLGGNGPVPAFSVSYTCDPPPQIPPAGAADQNPSFTTRSPYDCAISLAPLSGTDRRAQSKHFTFTTPGGQLVITQPISMGTILANDEDNGGFSFDNQDGRDVTITGLTLDVSYQYLTTAYGPLILRILDPKTNAPLGDYHLETTTTDPTTDFSHDLIVNVPLSFTIPANSQKMLPLEILGVHRMLITNTTPQITLTVKSISSDPNDIKPVLSAAQISWNCYAEIGGYDPNATSGPFASGRICTN